MVVHVLEKPGTVDNLFKIQKSSHSKNKLATSRAKKQSTKGISKKFYFFHFEHWWHQWHGWNSMHCTVPLFKMVYSKVAICSIILKKIQTV